MLEGDAGVVADHATKMGALSINVFWPVRAPFGAVCAGVLHVRRWTATPAGPKREDEVGVDVSSCSTSLSRRSTCRGGDDRDGLPMELLITCRRPRLPVRLLQGEPATMGILLVRGRGDDGLGGNAMANGRLWNCMYLS